MPQSLAQGLAQSHGDFEYVLVDNHSDDGGSEIAARYAARDRRIRVARPPRFLGQGIISFLFGRMLAVCGRRGGILFVAS